MGRCHALGIALASFVVVVALSCGGYSGEPAASVTNDGPTPTVVRPPPVGVIAIGHSGLTGENSDPNRPGQDAIENSWATGTAPEIKSVYQRLTAVRPETEGHVANYAKGGALAADLTLQARLALNQVPTPALVMIQTIDNDIRCDGTDEARIDDFGTDVADALKVITDASPDSRVLVVGTWWQPAQLAAVLATEPAAKASFTGSGMCDLFNSAGDLVEESVATWTAVAEGYEAEQARVCASVPQCRDDDGAFATFILDIADLSSDWNHHSVRGHTRLAETIWPTVVTLLELP